MSGIGALSTQTASIYALPTTDDTVAATDKDKDSKPKTPVVAATPAAPAGSFFASALMNVLLNAQASGTDASGTDTSAGVAGIDASSLLDAQTGSQLGLPQTNLLDNLTDSDRSLIAAAGVTLPSTDSGSDTTGVPTFVLQIAADRMTGKLSGDVTPDYWQNLASLDTSIGQPMDPQTVTAGLQALNGVTT